jgi:hypothetical protein
MGAVPNLVRTSEELMRRWRWCVWREGRYCG